MSLATPVRTTTLALRLDDVGVRYPDGQHDDGSPRFVTALDAVALGAEPGTLTAVVGPSGSGKSTLLSVVAGLVPPTSGTVTVGGTRLDRLDEQARTALRRSAIGIVFQQPNLLPSLTALEQLTLTAHLGGAGRAEMRAARERATALLARVGLERQAGRHPHQLSGGQRQRVNIARALMTSPSVLLVDEPTSALDHERSRAIVELLAEVTRERRTATLLVTHDLATTDVADVVVTMRDGRLDARREAGPSPVREG